MSATAFLVPHEPGEGATSDTIRTFIANENGELILAELSPQAYKEVSLLTPTNHDAGRPVVWCDPAFANRSVYWRNDRELTCVSLADESAEAPGLGR